MSYSYEYKRKCVELYRQGIWPPTPDGIKDEQNFYKMIHGWYRIEAHCGAETLKYKSKKVEHHKNAIKKLTTMLKMLTKCSFSKASIRL